MYQADLKSPNSILKKTYASKAWFFIIICGVTALSIIWVLHYWYITIMYIDVNIATQMIYDAMKNVCDVQYLLTGDSDLAPAVKLIKGEFPKRKIFLICPPKKNKADNNKMSESRISKELIRLCDNHQYIKEQNLKECQLPIRVRSKKGRVIICPEYWQ